LLEISEQLSLNVAVGTNDTADYDKAMNIINSLKLEHYEKIATTYHYTFPLLTYQKSDKSQQALMQQNYPIISEGEYSTIMMLR